MFACLFACRACLPGIAVGARERSGKRSLPRLRQSQRRSEQQARGLRPCMGRVPLFDCPKVNLTQGWLMSPPKKTLGLSVESLMPAERVPGKDSIQVLAFRAVWGTEENRSGLGVPFCESPLLVAGKRRSHPSIHAHARGIRAKRGNHDHPKKFWPYGCVLFCLGHPNMVATSKKVPSRKDTPI